MGELGLGFGNLGDELGAMRKEEDGEGKWSLDIILELLTAQIQSEPT